MTDTQFKRVEEQPKPTFGTQFLPLLFGALTYICMKIDALRPTSGINTLVQFFICLCVGWGVGQIVVSLANRPRRKLFGFVIAILAIVFWFFAVILIGAVISDKGRMPIV